MRNLEHEDGLDTGEDDLGAYCFSTYESPAESKLAALRRYFHGVAFIRQFRDIFANGEFDDWGVAAENVIIGSWKVTGNFEMVRDRAQILAERLSFTALCYVECGEVDIYESMKKGDFFILDFNHPFRISSKKGFVIYYFISKNDGVGRKGKEIREMSGLKLAAPLDKYIWSHVEEVFLAVRASRCISEELKEASLLKIRESGLLSYSSGWNLVEYYRKIKRMEVEKIVERNVTNADLSPEMICLEACISKRTLRVLFDEFGGVRQYIRKCRMRYACSDLAGNCYASVSEVAKLYGFSNLAYFSRLFKAEYGVSPSEVVNMDMESIEQGKFLC
ncbi:helix-turn-helix transcriptional regulator [Alcanivoracaceae bacterium MT1]